MPADLDKDIRTAIAGLITTASESEKVYPFNALSRDITDWPGLFRDNEGVHGWVVRRVAVKAERKNTQIDRKTWMYEIWGFYSFRSGKIGDNSDDEFAEICDAVYAAIQASPRLGFDNYVERHDLLQIYNMTTLDCGEETLHFCQARLAVHLCC